MTTINLRTLRGKNRFILVFAYMEKKYFYITTTLPYVNADPHVGFASEIVLADVRARFARMEGFDVVFNTGTDEHGQKIYQKALELGQDPKTYVDVYAKKFEVLKELLNLSYTHFIRTTDEHHVRATQELWRRVNANGFLYKKQYSVKYCVGCELEKTDSDLDHGECPFHKGKPLEVRNEENYFFRFSAFRDMLLETYKKYSDFVVPEKRMHEITAFLERGAEDFSVSRLKEKMPWGIPVPDDDEHVMYVWFDALTNYISTLHWPDDMEQFDHFWGDAENPNALQIAGKDNLRQQSAMWQAMLLAAKLPTSRQIFINGFITVDGQKMSKSLGNVLHPAEMVETFGIDGTRYLLLTKGMFGEDSDISWARMTEKYNSDLANGLGNLVSRAMKLLEDVPEKRYQPDQKADCFSAEFSQYVKRFQMDGALEYIMSIVRRNNQYIDQEKPWALKKSGDEKFFTVMRTVFADMSLIAFLLRPFMPRSSEKMEGLLSRKESGSLFQRIV